MTELSQEQELFVRALFSLNQTMKKLFDSGNIGLFTEMNAEIKQIYDLQHTSADPVLRALDIECGVIYRNFDMIVAVLRTTENGEIDIGAQAALNKFLHNIDDSVVNIAKALEVA